MKRLIGEALIRMIERIEPPKNRFWFWVHDVGLRLCDLTQ